MFNSAIFRILSRGEGIYISKNLIPLKGGGDGSLTIDTTIIYVYNK